MAGCDRMITQRQTQLARMRTQERPRQTTRSDQPLRSGARWERALADVHYKLALIYDDKMNDPLNALHHFKRFHP